MKLSYRGTHYDHAPVSTEMVESDIAGQYRGQAFHVTYPKHIPVPQPALHLQYRGVNYRTSGDGLLQTIPASVQTRPALEDEVMSAQILPFIQARQSRFSDLAKVHHDNLLRNLQRRLEVAKARGDQFLIRQLEDEMQQIA
jgi:Domain of unknown function (DUF4278)